MVNLVLKWNVKNQNVQRRDDIWFLRFIPIDGYIPIFVCRHFWPRLETRSIIDVLKLKEKKM
jgi:hypothetical protein